MSQYFGRLGSIDQTETIEKIMQASQEGLDNWIKLIQLVSDFIKDAGMRVSEMSSRAAAR
jgi:predicted RNase H-like HicB family nuclease